MSNRGRPPKKPVEIVDAEVLADTEGFARGMETMRQVEAAQTGGALATGADAVVVRIRDDCEADRDWLMRMVGHIEMAGATQKHLKLIEVAKIRHIRDEKLYRLLKGRVCLDGTVLAGTWEEFCTQFVGKDRKWVEEDIANLAAFGEAALDSMEKIGVGYRELKQYRRLPDEAREALSEAAQAGDKDSLLELAERLLGEKEKENAALKAQVADLRAERAASDEHLKEVRSNLDKMMVDSKRRERLPPEDKALLLRQEAVGIAEEAKFAIRYVLTSRILELMELERDHRFGHNNDLMVAGALSEIVSAINELRGTYCIPDCDGMEISEWMKQENEEGATPPKAS